MKTRSFRARLCALLIGGVVLSSSCSAGPHAKAAAPAPTPRAGVDYVVHVEADGHLDVTAHIGPGLKAIEIDDGTASFISELGIEGGARIDTPWTGATLDISKTAACHDGCTLHYRYDLARLADVVGDADSAVKYDGMYVTCPTAWLVRPSDTPDEAPFTLTMKTAAGVDFAFGDAGEKNVFRGAIGDLEQAPYAAVGSFRRMHFDDAPTLEIVVSGAEPSLGDARLSHWIHEAVENLRTFYDGYPVHHVLLIVHVQPGPRVGGATTMGNGGASIEVRFGEDATDHQVANDWILTHEMFHTAFPGLSREHHWAEEGMATYLEPIARARRGVVAGDEVWREWYESMPLGQPEPEDQGLDRTHTGGRTSWGGALFWFQMDIGARRASSNAKGIRDIFAQIYRQADVAVRWPMTKVVRACDEASASDVASKLYAAHAEQPVKVDLDGLFRDLGVRMDAGALVFDDAAPLASIRKAMVTGPTNER